MTATGPICFWSYTHRDDSLEGGRIRRLAASISNEYEILTGETLELFVDNTAIAWGDKWRSAINDALTRTAFFIPVITPLYLRSVECRREFLEFSGKAKSIGSMELLLPILYSPTPAMEDSDSEDEIVRLVRETQREDWTSLRLADEASEKYRTAVHQLAARLVEVMAVEAAKPLPELRNDEGEEGESGFLDDVAAAEENIESWQATMTDLFGELQKIQGTTVDITERLHQSDNRGGGARGRLVVLKNFADNIATPSRRINELGHEFARSVIASDPGVRQLILRSKAEALTPKSMEQAESLVTTITTLASLSQRMADGVEDFLLQLSKGDNLSRVIRSPIAQLRTGMSALTDANSVISEWGRLARQNQ
ncbi:TIR domain-containing protein [Micromonospora wenchangensis]|uniref:TIR domain-containing protein n=1 Tax=Micromonospora TaxID=1873 RepID=UPI0034118ECD